MYEGSIASLTPTVCALFGIEPPATSDCPALESVMRFSRSKFGVGALDRCLIYCPDALGNHLWKRFPEQAARITAECGHRASLSAVSPPKTPVCYASVFTGASPEVHGIRRYERPVLTCETLFDVMARSGRRVAIVAVRNSSIDLIFRNRDVDYFSEDYDQQVTAQAVSLLAANQHALIVAYHQEYDDQLHRTQPFSSACVHAMENHVAALEQLANAARKSWASHRYALAVAPDHGGHLNEETGRGDHGLDIAEDLSVSHFYDVFGARTEHSNPAR